MLGQVEPGREHGVQQLQPARPVHLVMIVGHDVRNPALHDLVDGHLDVEHAARIQVLHEGDVPRAQGGGRKVLLARDELVETQLLSRVLQGFEPGVLRERDLALVDQRAIGAQTHGEIAHVGLLHFLGEDDRHAQLISATQVEMDAIRVERARREPRVEGRLVALVEHSGTIRRVVPVDGSGRSGLGRGSVLDVSAVCPAHSGSEQQ